MIDWSQPIEWSNGEPADFVEVIPTVPPAYVRVTLPVPEKRDLSFPTIYRNPNFKCTDVDIETGLMIDFNGPWTKPFKSYGRIRNKI